MHGWQILIGNIAILSNGRDQKISAADSGDAAFARKLRTRMNGACFPLVRNEGLQPQAPELKSTDPEHP